MNYIYRDYSCTLSKEKCAKLLQSLAISKGVITCLFTLSGAFPESTVNRWTMFFKLRFLFQADLDKFHSLGFETTDPPKYTLNNLVDIAKVTSTEVKV